MRGNETTKKKEKKGKEKGKEKEQQEKENMGRKAWYLTLTPNYLTAVLCFWILGFGSLLHWLIDLENKRSSMGSIQTDPLWQDDPSLTLNPWVKLRECHDRSVGRSVSGENTGVYEIYNVTYRGVAQLPDYKLILWLIITTTRNSRTVCTVITTYLITYLFLLAFILLGLVLLCCT